MPAASRLVSSGAVVGRRPPGSTGKAALEVLLVHRPKYDDWSFPKGKPDPHEHVTAAAVREVAEETGLHIRLGPPLAPQTYPVSSGPSGSRTKTVHYWVGRVVGDDDVGGYPANDEIDQVAWVPLRKATQRLTYPHDLDTLQEYLRLRKKSYPLVVLRHSQARDRKSWQADDRERPLTMAGELQADRLVPLLAAYGVTTLVSSSSRRCWTTVGPYAELSGQDIENTPDLSEERATSERVAAVVGSLLEAKAPTVLCTHRPVLPLVFQALGVDAIKLEPGGLAVVHHRRARVVAVEAHRAPRGR